MNKVALDIYRTTDRTVQDRRQHDRVLYSIHTGTTDKRKILRGWEDALQLQIAAVRYKLMEGSSIYISGILIMNYYMKNIIYIIINIIMKYRIFDFSFQILIIFTLYVYIDKNYQNFRGVGWIFSMDLLLFKVKYKE